MTFYDDLPKGEKIERKHLEYIKNIFPDTIKIEGYCKEYDLFSPSNNLGFEVKYDEMSNQTGNIVVEIEMPPNKPSGLSTTKASIWIFDTGIESFYVKTDDLKKLVRNFQPRIFTGKGDITKKKAYLIKKHFIKNISIGCLK